LTSYEEAPYVNILKKQIDEKFNHITENMLIYGTLLMSDKFRIVDKTQQKKMSGSDSRPTVDGRICEQSKKPPIIKILIHEERMMSSVVKIDVDENLGLQDLSSKKKYKAKIDYLVKQKFYKDISEAPAQTPNQERRINAICKWYISGIVVQKMCAFLLNHFRNTNKLIVT
jgi:hypothetical protein